MTRTLLRQARDTTRRRQEPTDWYTIGLAGLIVVGLPVQMLVGVATRSYRPGTFAGVPVAFIVGLVVMVVAAMVTSAMAVGPVRASRAEYSCILSAPIDRRRELRRRWLGNALAGGVVGTALGASAVILNGDDVDAVVCGAVLGLGIGAAVMQTATVLQCASDHVRARVQGGAAVVGLVTLIAMAVVPSTPATPRPVGVAWVVTAGAGLLLAVLAGWWAWSSIAVLDRVALTAGNALATATSAAVVFLDPGLLGAVLAERRLARSRVSRSRSFPGGRLTALLAADFWRTARNRRALAVFAAAALVPYTTERVLPARWVPVVALVCGVTAVSPFAIGFRQIKASPVLRRMLGGTDATLRAIHLVVPAALSVVFAVATVAAAPGHVRAAVIWVPLGIVLTLWVRTWGQQAEFTTAIADVGFGPVPVGLVLMIVRSLGPIALIASIQLHL